MSNYTTTDTELTSIANAIRAKTGGSSSLTYPTDYISGINSIQALVCPKDVNFYDYDGTLVYSYTASEFLALTALPSAPTHSGLTSQGWNWTLVQAKAYVTNHGVLNVGPMYAPVSGGTEIIIDIPDWALTVWSHFHIGGRVDINWGDGNTDSNVYGQKKSYGQYYYGTLVKLQHTYQSAGTYTITIKTNDTLSSNNIYGLPNDVISIYETNPSDTTGEGLSMMHALTSGIKEIHVESSCYMLNFNYTYNIKGITFPNDSTCGTAFNAAASYYQVAAKNSGIPFLSVPTNTTIFSCSGSNSFVGMYALKHLALPESLNTFGVGISGGLCAIEELYVPDNLTTLNFGTASTYGIGSVTRQVSRVEFPKTCTTYNSIGAQFLINQTKIKSFDLTNVKYIYNAAFNSSGLETIVIPASVESIGTTAFSTVPLHEIHFQGTTPPTLSAQNTFLNLPTSCKIYVPTGYLSAYTSAQYYPSSSTYTYIEE